MNTLFKRLCILCIIFFFPMQLFAAPKQSQTKRDGSVEWTQASNWVLPGKPVDLVHSLDNKKVFILTDDNKVYIYSVKGQKIGVITVDEGVSAIDIEPRGQALYLINSKTNSFSSLQIGYVVDIDTQGSPSLGKEDAPVNLVIFTDFQCPYCKKAEPLLTQVLKNNPDTVKIIFKNMPLSMHKFAEPAARAAIAAKEQGKFWEMHDALFAADKLNKDKIDEVATKVGLDMKKFKEDMKSPLIGKHLAKDLLTAKEVGVTGTPTLFVNGRRVKNRSMNVIQQMIDEESGKLSKKDKK